MRDRAFKELEMASPAASSLPLFIRDPEESRWKEVATLPVAFSRLRLTRSASKLLPKPTATYFSHPCKRSIPFSYLLSVPSNTPTFSAFSCHSLVLVAIFFPLLSLCMDRALLESGYTYPSTLKKSRALLSAGKTASYASTKSAGGLKHEDALNEVKALWGHKKGRHTWPPRASGKPHEYSEKEASSLLKYRILRIRVPPVPAVHDAVTSVNTRIEIIDYNA